METVFIPVTRPWSADAVVSALDASDCPKRVLLLFDAPNCVNAWLEAFDCRGWTVAYVETGQPDPPQDRVDRRTRHIIMRRRSQTLTEHYDRVLYLEDDTVVPSHVWSSLSELIDRDGYPAVSGIQRDRHGSGLFGVWRFNEDAGCFDPLWFDDEPTYIEADAVGHYCLMTSGALYAGCPIPLDTQGSVDRAHTHQMRPIAVDTTVRCGHLLTDGVVLV